MVFQEAEDVKAIRIYYLLNIVGVSDSIEEQWLANCSSVGCNIPQSESVDG